VRPVFTPETRANACYAVLLEFVVDASGTPEIQTARVVRTNNQAYADAVLATLPLRRYEPARRGDAPVRQIVTESDAMQVRIVAVPAGGPPPSGAATPHHRGC
jgi:hypothetical protein